MRLPSLMKRTVLTSRDFLPRMIRILTVSHNFKKLNIHTVSLCLSLSHNHTHTHTRIHTQEFGIVKLILLFALMSLADHIGVFPHRLSSFATLLSSTWLWRVKRLPHLLALRRLTTRTWWSPTCGPSCRSRWRRTHGCRKESKTWRRRGTSCVASWTVSSSPRRAMGRSRDRASIATVRREDGWQAALQELWRLFFL